MRKSTLTPEAQDQLDRAQQFVREVVTGIFKQRISDTEVLRLARRVVTFLPKSMRGAANSGRAG